MPLFQNLKSPPETTSTTTHEQLAAQSLDLYSILSKAASTTHDTNSFCAAVESMLAQQLGQGRFGTLVSVHTNESNGGGDLVTTGLSSNNSFWAGSAGVLPGFGAHNGVTCLVWWS